MILTRRLLLSGKHNGERERERRQGFRREAQVGERKNTRRNGNNQIEI